MKKQVVDIMHKDTPVATISLDERGFVDSVEKVYNKGLLPCYESDDEKDLQFGIQRWLLSRDLGRTRSDYSPLKTFYGNDMFLSQNKASLFDCYWLKVNENQTWENVNLFANWDYEEDEYFGLLFNPEEIEGVHCKSPNLTIPGCEHQFWYKIDDQLGLISEASQKDMKMYKKAVELGVEKYVSPRNYVVIRGTIYSFHPVSTSEEVERVPFDILYDSIADENLSKIENLKKCCEKFGLSNWRDFFSSVIKLDESLGNKERNLCEFGVLRNTQTLETVGFELL